MPKSFKNETIVSKVEFPLEHFSLQLAYAKRAIEILNISTEKALLEFTQYWRRVHNIEVLKVSNNEWSFDPTTPQWQELCNRINNNESADVIAYELYLENGSGSENHKEYFGCFRFDFVSQIGNDYNVIKIHFKNRDNSSAGPLSIERHLIRISELKKMFEAISKRHPEAEIVHGGSWLYNLKSYQRLFPKSFVSNMDVELIPFPRSSGVWGQFLNSEGVVSKQRLETFLKKVKNAENKNQLLQCFEFKILFPKTTIENFYSYYKIVKGK